MSLSLNDVKSQVQVFQFLHSAEFDPNLRITYSDQTFLPPTRIVAVLSLRKDELIVQIGVTLFRVPAHLLASARSALLLCELRGNQGTIPIYRDYEGSLNFSCVFEYS